MILTKREYIALELLKSRDISVITAISMADGFISSMASSCTTNDVLSQDVGCLNLSTRANNVLRAQYILTIGDLVKKTHFDMLGWKNTGGSTIREFKNALDKNGLSLGMTNRDIDEYKPLRHYPIVEFINGFEVN